jgi:ATP-dependent DNA helicase RecG
LIALREVVVIPALSSKHSIRTAAQAGLDQAAPALRGVGPALAGRLQRLGIERAGDLLFLLPVRYEDRTQIRALGSLNPGERVLVEGDLELAEVVFRRRRALLCRIGDGTGALTLRFFHFNAAQREMLARGARIRCYGEVRAGRTGLEMVHPEYRVISSESLGPEPTLTPIYPSTEGLQQQRLRMLVDQVLQRLDREPLTDFLRDQLPASWPGLDAAIRYLHRPPSDADRPALLAGRHPCQRRLAVEELVAQRLSLKRSALDQYREQAEPLDDRGGALARVQATLPFVLTGAQRTVLKEIVHDLGQERPMHRLLQGDVGSGKTVVAALAAALTASGGRQCAVMAPTELLAEQHFASFKAWLEPAGLRVVLLTGGQSAADRSAVLEAIKDGAAEVAIGTHALFQQAVEFAALALVVVDEQHRFGVHQRLELRLKGQRLDRVPHQLVMTATPIPRTLAMTAYADLDCSTIDELPAGRQPVRTVVMPERRRVELVERVLGHCRSHQQAYWVCPLIEESETLDSQAALELERGLKAALPELAIGLIHGRMKGSERDRAMRAFKSGALDLLVATTVIEVGVDVPNATLMVVENAERMGLAQLHQLRGRVGRGDKASSCVLLYKPPLTSVARARLDVMRQTNDGFRVAQKDLELRGPGEVLGTRQTGLVELRVANLLRDADLLPTVIKISDHLLAHSPERVDPLIKRWVSGSRAYASV